MASSIQALQSRSWNGTPITRRTTDGYVNATSMAKASGKQWHDYWRTDRATEYLEALSAETGIHVSSLCLTTRGGAHQGTWIHPRVAIDFARWISAPFAVWMDGWFLEELESARKPEVQDVQLFVALPVEAMLTTLERAAILMEQFGGFDDRDQLLFRDLTRNTVLRAAGSTIALPPAPEDEEMTISDAWLEVIGSALPRGQGSAVGRLVAALYREEFSEEPPSRMQYVDGAPRQVKSYKRGWLLKTMEALKAKMPKN